MQNNFVNPVDNPLTLGTPAPTQNGIAPFRTLREHLRDQELAHISRAIEYAAGDKKKAAVVLGISLATLYRKLDLEHQAV